MSYVCLWIPRSATGAEQTGDTLTAALLDIAPHVALETRAAGALYWVDARGQHTEGVARGALRIASQGGAADARAGVANSAVAAELAAVKGATATGSSITIIPPDCDARFLAPHPLTALAEAAGDAGMVGTRRAAKTEDGERHSTTSAITLISALHGVGIETCGDLARLTRAAIELRFGPPGVALWRLATADKAVHTRHPLALFPPRRRPLPSASLSWDDHLVYDLEQLAFVVNRLIVTVCDGLQERGEGARSLAVTIALANRSTLDCSVRAARPTASRNTWARLVRAALDRITLPDAATGLSIRVDAAGDAGAQQGDLFDRGFQAGAAVAEALAELVDDGRATIVGLPRSSYPAERHPLLERRARWRARTLNAVLREDELRAARAVASRSSDVRYGSRSAPALALQLLPEPRRVNVRTVRRRTYHVPVHFADSAREEERGPWASDVPLITAAGPDHVSGGAEAGAPYAREYFHCLTSDGVLVLLYRDVPPPLPSAPPGTDAAGAEPGKAPDGSAAGTTPKNAPASSAVSTKRGTTPVASPVWYVHGWWD